MSDFFKKCAAALLAAGTAVIMTAGYCSQHLPDRFYCEGNEALTLPYCVSAKPCQSDLEASSTAGSRKSTETLLLFGSVPIKNVEKVSAERPMLMPCGEPFGIKLITQGVLIVGLCETNGKCSAQECGLEKGDVILSINGKPVSSNEQLGSIIAQSGGKPCEVSYERNGKQKQTTLTPHLIGGAYKAGMWVRDSSAGIGTMTFYEASSGLFGGLGHPICDADIKTPLPLSKGKTGEIRLTDYSRSRSGSPGWLTGDFVNSSGTGTVYKNCSCGVFGALYSPPKTKNPSLPMAFRQELHNGDAYIYASIDTQGPKKYSVRISGIDLAGSKGHDFDVEITDPELLEKTGGILQGMSGSPVIQDGRLAGAVTHVLVDDPKCGYGIFADRMYAQLQDIPHELEKTG